MLGFDIYNKNSIPDWYITGYDIEIIIPKNIVEINDRILCWGSLPEITNKNDLLQETFYNTNLKYC